MKDHVILKLRQRHPDDDRIVDWVAFIDDKSRERTRVTPEIDAVAKRFGVCYWLTNEYSPSGVEWNKDEVAYGLDRTYRLIVVQPDKVPAGFVDALRNVPGVEDVKGITVATAPVPRPEVAVATSRVAPGPAEMIYLPVAKALTRGSDRVTVAVLDTGIDRDHPELAGKASLEADFVDIKGLDTTDFIGDIIGYDSDATDKLVGHGIHVAGIISARGLRMEEGVAPACRLMAVRVLAAMRDGDRVVGAGIVDNINVGIKWAVDNGADVINMSLGIKHEGGGLPHADVIRYALQRQVTVVAASGNDGTAARYYPGALPGVLAIGAVDSSGNVAGFTSFGANIFALAPGLNVYSSTLGRGYAFMSGTSQASPFVAGSVALMKSYAIENGKRLRNDDIRYILTCTSDRMDRRFRNQHAGFGLLNLSDAFKLLAHELH